uniref:protein INCA1 isoform X1 n=2 Tax=Pristiophorus japonicus TaxID=55135 RepID=UPI00398E5C5C
MGARRTAAMSQHFRTPWSLQDSPVDENEENFIPFVTRSKTVSRCKAEDESGAQCSAAVRDWACVADLERPVQLAVPHWMEVYEEAPPRLLSSQAAQRPDAKQDIRRSSPAMELERLPSPRELYGKRKGKRKAAGEGRVLAVIYHLEELKRRQTNIDQQKSLKWGANTSPCLTPDVEEPVMIDPAQQPADTISIADFTNNTDLEDTELFFKPRWNVGVTEQRPPSWNAPYPAYFQTEAEENHATFGFPREPVWQNGCFWEAHYGAEE